MFIDFIIYLLDELLDTDLLVLLVLDLLEEFWVDTERDGPELLLTDLLLLDGDVTVLLVDLLLDTDPVGLLLTDLLLLDGDDVTVLVEDELLLDTLLPLLGDVVADLLGDDVSTLLPVDLDSEDTLLLDTDLLGDDVSTLLVFTVLSGVEPEFLLVVPFTCRLGVYVSTFLGLGFE